MERYILPFFETQPLQWLRKTISTRHPKFATFVKGMFPSLKERIRTKETFELIHRTKAWGAHESHSGEGSTLAQTVVLRRELPSIIRSIGARILLDAPCGDHFWMKELSLNLDLYIGVDVVKHLVEQNNQKYGCAEKRFIVRDITKDKLPQADCILCRDFLDHLSFDHIFRAIDNFRRSGARHLLATTYTTRTHNDDIVTGDWRPTNLQKPPLSFPHPIKLIIEECSEEEGKWSDKSLGLWRITDLPQTGGMFGS